MAEVLTPTASKEALPAKTETTSVNEYAFYQVYPDPENKMDVLNNGFEGNKLAVPFTPRGGKQRGRDGRQLAIGVDPNDPHKLVMPEDVRPYDGLKDSRRNKPPNEVDNVVVFERWGNRHRGYSLYEVTGQRTFNKVERGAEFNLGEQTLTVIGLDKNGNIVFYKGALDYYPEQRLPPIDLPELPNKKIKLGTPPKIRFPGGFLKRKRMVTQNTPSSSPTVTPLPERVPFTPPPIPTDKKPSFKPGTSTFGDPNLRLFLGEMEALLRGDEKVFPDHKTVRRIGRLMKVRLPDFDRRRLLVLPLLLLLVASIPRSTNPNIPFPIGQGPKLSVPGPTLDVPMPEAPYLKPITPPAPVVPTTPRVEPVAPPKPPEPTPTALRQVPWDIKEFRDGVGLKNARYVTADYTVRDDYKAKIKPEVSRLDDSVTKGIEGYSIRGMVEADLAKAFNPELKNEAEKFETEGKVLPEGDDKLRKTLDILRIKLGEGVYKEMVDDFETRQRGAVADQNQDLGIGFDISARVDGKITEGRFRKWDIDGVDLDTWFKLRRESGKDANLPGRQEISDEITKQISEGGFQP